MDANDGKFWSCVGRDLQWTCNLEGWSIGPYQYLKTTGQSQSKYFQVCWKQNWVATSQNLIFKLEPTLLEGLRVAPDLSKRVELVCRTAYTTASQAKTKKGIAAIADGEMVRLANNNSWAETPVSFTVPDDLRCRIKVERWRIHAFNSFNNVSHHTLSGPGRAFDERRCHTLIGLVCCRMWQRDVLYKCT